MNPFKRNFSIAALLCFALLAGSIAVWPGARAGFLLTALAVIYAVTFIVYGRCPFRTRGGAWILLAGITLATFGVIININYYTAVFNTGYDNPMLLNWDSSLDWNSTIGYLTGDSTGLAPSKRNLCRLAAGLMAVFGRDIGVPLMFNVLCYSLTLIIMGAISWTLTASRRIATATMLCGLLMCYLLEQTAVFIKDVEVTMLMGLAALVMTRWRVSEGRGVTGAEVAGMFTAIVGLAFLRGQAMYMIILGAVMMGVRRNPWRFDLRFAAVIAFAAGMRFLTHHILIGGPKGFIRMVDHGLAMKTYVTDSDTRIYEGMIGIDGRVSLAHKLLMLPAALGLQFLLPLPWTWASHLEFGPFTAVAHFGFFWYYAAALVVYRVTARLRATSPAMLLLVAWAVLLTVVSAYLDAGRASRYCLPYLPMLLPAAAATLVLDRRRRSLHVWLGVYTVILAAVLITVYYLHTAVRL